jgi:hypothetical protein
MSLSKVLVAYGPSQSGKSSAIKILKVAGQQHDPEIGSGDGESVTQETKLYDTHLGWKVLDTPGNDDTKFRFSNDEAGRRVALGISGSGSSCVNFLLFESLANCRLGLRDTVKNLVEAFGEEAKKGTVVLATMPDVPRCLQKRQRRLQCIGEVARELGLSSVVVWQSEDLEDGAFEHQVSRLPAAVKA